MQTGSSQGTPVKGDICLYQFRPLPHSENPQCTLAQVSQVNSYSVIINENVQHVVAQTAYDLQMHCFCMRHHIDAPLLHDPKKLRHMIRGDRSVKRKVKLISKTGRLASGFEEVLEREVQAKVVEKGRTQFGGQHPVVHCSASP
jgi:hypothetical protein